VGGAANANASSAPPHPALSPRPAGGEEKILEVKPIVRQTLSVAEYHALLRRDLVSFAQCCFRELNPRTCFAMNWHIEIIAAKLTAVRDGTIRRLVVNLPPRHLKSLLASVAFPAWCLGHDPSAQILCVSYAQDLADKLSRDCALPRLKCSWKLRCCLI
jgi:hypothetical protein